MSQHVMLIFGGSFLLLSTVFVTMKGAIPLRPGGEISRRKDPLGFWMAVACMGGLGTFLLVAGLK
jgi:hypothetical protein